VLVDRVICTAMSHGRTVVRRYGVLVAGLALMILATACPKGSDERPSPSPSVGANAGPIAAGTYKFTGAIESKGKYRIVYPLDEKARSTCARLASGAGGYSIPTPPLDGDRRFTWTLTVSPYKGPGTYGLSKFVAISVDVRKTPKAKPVRYKKPETAQLKVDKDNAGSLSFTDIAHGDTKFSGLLTWECSDRSER